MKLFTFDLETENHIYNKRKASPFDPQNYIVQVGWSLNGGKPHEQYYSEWHRDDVLPVDVLDSMGAGDVIIGFNIKFDLLWTWKEKALQAALKRGVVVYCGQYTEYLLGGMQQEVQMVSMNAIAEQYGGGCKIDAVKELWEAGALTSEIPRNLLTDYLIGDGKAIVGDVHNTWLIFKGQVARMNSEHPKEFKTMHKLRMDGLLASTEMEHNGVYCDTELGEKQRLDLLERIEVAEETLESFIPELPEELEFNWGSPVHKSCLIFGGTAKYLKWVAHKDTNGNPLYSQKTVKWPLFNNHPYPEDECIKAGELFVRMAPEGTVGAFMHKGTRYVAQDTFKSGKNMGIGKTKNMQVPDTSKPKGAKKDHYFTFKGYTTPLAAWEGKNTDAYDKPLYSVGSTIIEKLGKRGLKFTDALSTYTGMTKDLGTYYWMEKANGTKSGMLTLVTDQSIINHKLNHTSTVTGRMSSSDPNLQNIPRGDKSDVKRMFKSRFGTTGRMAEIDYSQLEIVIQGVLTRDPQLMEDLNNRVDFHCKRLSKKLDEDYQHVWNMCHKEEDPVYKKGRTEAKVFSFQRAYGAGADTISVDTGIKRSDVDALIEAEAKLYPQVQLFDNNLQKHIERSRRSTSSKLFLGDQMFTRGESIWDSPTGTRYIWREQIAPKFMQERGKYVSFSPTERKNYPMQGFGGEVVQAMLGKVWRYLLENDNFGGRLLLVNTVHDCLWLDGLLELVLEQAPKIQKILESVPTVFNNAFPKLNVEVPFPCETEVGKDMYTMEVLQ